MNWRSLRPSEVELRDGIAKGVLEAMVQGILTAAPNSLANADTDALARAAYKMADSLMKVRAE